MDIISAEAEAIAHSLSETLQVVGTNATAARLDSSDPHSNSDNVPDDSNNNNNNSIEEVSSVYEDAIENDSDNQKLTVTDPDNADVLSGRGASVNAHWGNKKFRALCFSRKAEFEAANHAAKRRIATEIVQNMCDQYQTRFLKKKDKGPWIVQTREQAILKAAQVIRDYQRPDRLAQRELMTNHSKKRARATSTPMDDVLIPPPPAAPIVENPYGVHDHDILCGRGAAVNCHKGNQTLRELAIQRKAAFDAGNFAEKRSLATEIVSHIRALDPPGRFLRKVRDMAKVTDPNSLAVPPTEENDGWEELNDEKAIHKACQVMRDIDRPDRREREERRRIKKLKKEGINTSMLAESTADASVGHAVAAVEDSMEKALEAVEESVQHDIELQHHHQDEEEHNVEPDSLGFPHPEAVDESLNQQAI